MYCVQQAGILFVRVPPYGVACHWYDVVGLASLFITHCWFRVEVSSVLAVLIACSCWYVHAHSGMSTEWNVIYMCRLDAISPLNYCSIFSFAMATNLV